MKNFLIRMYNKNCTACYNPELDRLIYGIKYTLEKLSGEVVKSFEFGFSCDKNAKSKIETLNAYLLVLQNETNILSLGGEACLKPYYLQSLAEKVRKLTLSCDLSERKDQIVDRSKEHEWIIQNPYCVTREKWEKVAYTICDTLKLDVKVTKDSEKDCDLKINVLSEEEVCNLSFEVVRTIIPCDIILAISVYKQVCDLNLEVSRTEEECRLDFNILAEQVNCDLDLQAYNQLVDCNLSFDIIKTVYENGCSFEVQGAEVLLSTMMNKYPLSKLNFTGIPSVQDLKKLKIAGANANSKYIKNPQVFIDKLKSDYKHGKRS